MKYVVPGLLVLFGGEIVSLFALLMIMVLLMADIAKEGLWRI